MRAGFLLACVAAALLTGCAGTTPGPGPNEPTMDTGTVVGEAGDPRNRARLHTELASAYYERGSMGVALEELRIAVAADPSYPTAHGMFGLVYMELRENQLAEQSFERALKLAPSDPDINHNYGWFLCQTRREPASIKYFLQAIRNPLYKAPQRSYTAAGQCALKVNNLKDAEELLQRALKLDPDDPTSTLQMAQLRYRQGNLQEARQLAARHNRSVSPTAESLWLAARVERKLGDRAAENGFASQLRRRFPQSAESQALQRGDFE